MLSNVLLKPRHYLCCLKGIAVKIVAAAALCLSGPMAAAQGAPVDAVNTISPLTNIKPLLPDTSAYIQDMTAARQLGKALFWDTQAGSDGVACASCHFHAGADIRIKNQVNPGLKAGDGKFDPRASNGSASGPNALLSAADFPFHRLENPGDRQSRVLFDTNDVFSSEGTFGGDFISSTRGAESHRMFGGQFFLGKAKRNEKCNLTYDPANNPFHANGLIYRKVEPRQTPTTINAVFNYRQFWDGRANSVFNGLDPFGPRTYTSTFSDGGVLLGNPDAAGAGILAAGSPRGELTLEKPLIQNASLASQAVGPPLSDFEMSCSHKSFADLGRKIILLRALATQEVSPSDSLFSRTPGLVGPVPWIGLSANYKALIEKAFNPKYWSAKGRYTVNPSTGAITSDSLGGFTQEEHNFSLFWGLAIQAYEQTLISDDTPFDRGGSAMSAEARAGMDLFTGKAKCVACHHGPLFSGATVTEDSTDSPKVIEGMLMGDNAAAIYDNGFYNVGVRPSREDLGVGGLDPYGFDLSFTREYKWKLLQQSQKSPDRFDPKACSFASPLFPDCANPPSFSNPASAPRDAVDGAFKTPILRNVGLNPPYFHNGGQSNLKDVVRFYNRGGDRRGPIGDDTSGRMTATPFGVVNTSNLDPDIGDLSNTSANNALGLTETEMDAIVEFLLSLSDQRVACHAAPFDHPALPLPMGQKDVAKAGGQVARDQIAIFPATGKSGLPVCFPNSGDLFGSLNKNDPRGLQSTFSSIVK